jgi:hypothetical protein
LIGKRYTIQIKAKPGNSTQVSARVRQLYPHAQLTDSHDDLLVFQLPSASDAADAADDASVAAGAGANASIAPVFAALVEMKGLADDFSVSQTTLEQVFLKLAKEKDTQ